MAFCRSFSQTVEKEGKWPFAVVLVKLCRKSGSGSFCQTVEAEWHEATALVKLWRKSVEGVA